jgi:hypothetical protein
MTPVVEAKCQLTGSIVILAPFRHTELELAQGRRAASLRRSRKTAFWLAKPQKPCDVRAPPVCD